MATATMTYTGPADGQASLTFNHVGLIPDELVSHFFDAHRVRYGKIDVKDADGKQIYINPDGSETTAPAIFRTMKKKQRDMTDAEAWERYTQEVAATISARVQQYLQDEAKKAALAQVPTVSVTQQS